MALEEAKHKKRLERQSERDERVRVRQGACSSLKGMLVGDSSCEMIDVLQLLSTTTGVLKRTVKPGDKKAAVSRASLESNPG